MPGSAREEAERLVATILARAAAGQAAEGLGHLGESVRGLLGGASGAGPWSTGSAECCVCPVCKAIAAVRDPSPETTERLATSAGEIASGVAGLMRAFSSMAAQPPRTPAPRPKPSPDQAWAAATRPSSAEPGLSSGEPVGDTPDADTDPWGAVSAEDARRAEEEIGRAHV